MTTKTLQAQASRGDVNPGQATFTVPARAIIRPLAMAALFVIAAGIASTVALVLGFQRPWALFRLFNPDVEGNVPTWFSSIMLAISALLPWINACVSRKSDFRKYAKCLAGAFVALSLDEVAQIHEQLAYTISRWHPFGGPFRFAWVLPAIPAVAVMAVVYRRFVWSLPADIRKLTILAGCLYIAGALGFEMLDGAYASAHGIEAPGYRLMTLAEETLEIVGLLLWVSALAKLLEMRVASARGSQRADK